MSRRGSFFSIFDHNTQKKDNDAPKSKGPIPNNPYLKTLFEQTNILRETALPVYDRKKACENISFCFYLGGGVIEPSMKKDSQIIDVAINIIMDSNEDYEVKLVIFNLIIIESIRTTKCYYSLRQDYSRNLVREKSIFSIGLYND
jgi:hypothetical protein